MTTIHCPTSTDCEIETCDLSRLAFEYRNSHDPEVLELISRELERRDKLRDELAAALRAIAEDYPASGPSCIASATLAKLKAP